MLKRIITFTLSQVPLLESQNSIKVLSTGQGDPFGCLRVKDIALFQVSGFVFENEVLGYNGGILII